MPSDSPQGKWWILTIPEHDFSPDSLPAECQHIHGQLEVGDGGFRHWQLVVTMQRKSRLRAVKSVFGSRAHCEATRSEAARAYVQKDETAVEGTRFELGKLPIRRNEKTDWQSVWELAKSGRVNVFLIKVDEIDSNIRVVHYRTLRAIQSDYAPCPSRNPRAKLFFGKTGTGKSKLAWEEAGGQTYTKDPRTKFWDGYQGEPNVIFDEFRGAIDVAHILRWLDRYPCRVEIKGSSVPLRCENFWFTSNLPLEQWYPTLDPETLGALRRRFLLIKEFN